MYFSLVVIMLVNIKIINLIRIDIKSLRPLNCSLLFYIMNIKKIHIAFKKVVLFTTVLLLVACTSTTKIKDVKPLTTNQLPLNSPEEEKLLMKSDRIHAEIVKKGLLVRNNELNQYIIEVADKVSPKFEHENIELNYYILKDASVNAVAFPNGNIYLNVGLISKLASEEQLAFVLAHEIAHVVNRHSLLSTITRKNTIASSHVVNMFLMGTNLIYLATLNELYSFSREKEDEADYEAMKYLVKAELNILEGMEAIKGLKQVKHTKENTSIWSTHDSIDERVNVYGERLDQHQWQPINNRVTIERYQQFRVKVTELVVMIRLRNKQFELAEDVVKQELELFPDNPLLHFYLGEVNRLKVQEPDAAAKEYAWLYNKDNDEDLKIELATYHAKYLHQAWLSYNKAINIDDEFHMSYRGLGMLAIENNENEKAKEFFTIYLNADDIKDRRYIEALQKSID